MREGKPSEKEAPITEKEEFDVRQQTMKKLCALVLTAVLAAAGLPALTAPAQAATDEATTVVMANDYGTVWTLQDGETKEGRDEAYTASYADGVLTLTDASGSDNVGCHEITTACYASIYADGNLTIRFEGDRNSCTFNLGALEMGEAVQSYGIYVKGNLTIINGQCNTGTRTIKFAPTKDAPPTQRSAGIYCEGSLTIANESEDGFYLIAEAAGVEATDGNVGSNFFNYGIYAAGAITIGGYCTVEATAADVALSTYNGSTHSYGVSCDNGDLTLEQDATLHATAGDINANDNWERVSLSNYQYSRGIYVPGGGVKVNKGSILTATGGNITFDEEGTLTGSTGGCLGSESYGIYSGSVTMNGYKLTAKAGSVNTTIGTTYSISQGIHTGTLTVSAGTLTAAADDAWKESIGIWATSNITQTGGAITSTGGVAICSGDVGTGSRGVFVAGTLTASAGTLTATGGQMGNKIPTVGLIANSVSLSGTAQVTGIGGDTMKDTGCVPNTSITGEGGFGSYPGDSIGVQLFDDFTVDDSAVLTGIGGTITSAENAAAEAKSVGLRIETADAVTVTGSGTVSATGGETTRGSKSANTFVDTSYGIYGDLPALTVSGTNISATGGDVCTKHFVNDYYNGGLSYGLYLVTTDTSSLTLTDGAKITATGGENANYSTTFDRVPKYNDSYGAYVKGDITLTDSTLSATGGLSQRVCGLSCTGAVTLNGLTSRLDAVAGDYHSDAAGTDWSYGFISGESEALPGGNLTVNRGAFTARGQSDALEYQLGTNTVTSTVIMAGSEWDGSNATKRTSPQRFNQFYGVNYLRADSANVYVTVSDWAYGDTASTLSYTAYEGDASVSWSGTTAGGTAYSGTEPPTKVGDYTVTVTYSTGETGSANVKVTPRQISWCNISLVEGSIYPYTGEAKTFGIRVSNGETLLVEDIDYTLEDDTATDAGTYTMIVTGKGSYTGTHPIEYYISRAVPTTDDFLIREIEARDYTGEPIVVEPPELAPPKTGMGEVTIRYNGETTPPTNAGEYTVTFDVADGKNYAAAAGLEYGTLVIGKIDNPMELKADAVEVFTGDTVDLKDYITNLGGDAAVISLPEEPNDCALGCTLENGVLTAGDVTGEFTVRVRAPGDVNYNSAEASITVTVAQKLIPTVTAQPANQTAASGTKATFTVGASGTGLTYQWQWKGTTSTSQWANTNLSGFNTENLTVNATSTVNGRQYRCIVTGANGESVTSEAATLTLLEITAQPEAQTAASGAKATFTVEASGSGLTYQWQYSANGGSTWSNTTLSGYNTATLAVTASSAVNGRQYRCIVTGTNGSTVTSEGAKLTVGTALKITAQPEAQTVASGAKATFTVGASGTGLTYQWQYSANGGSTWSNTTLSGYNTATLKVTASSTVNGRQYRCIVTDANGDTVTSDGAKLTVG